MAKGGQIVDPSHVIYKGQFDKTTFANGKEYFFCPARSLCPKTICLLFSL